MEKIEKIKDDLYIHKGLLGWKIVYPFKKDIDKPYSWNNLNWKNILIGGSWENFIIVIIILFLIAFISWSYVHDTQLCMKVIENPCQYSYRMEYGGLEGMNLSNLSSLIPPPA